MSSRLALSIGLAVALVPLAACGGDDGPSVTIYSGRTESLIGPILADFEEQTGIDVEVKYGQSADLALLVDEEMAAGKRNVDVFLSQSPGAMGYLDDGGRLGVLPADIVDLVPPSVRDVDGRWVGFSGRQRVLVYNTDVLDDADLPMSVFDLVDPAWQGRIGIAPANGSFQDFVSAMRVMEGDERTEAWLAGLAANDPVAYENNNAIVEAVARGEVEVGLTNHYYNYRRLVEIPSSPTANHQFAAGDPGSVLVVTGAGVLTGAEADPDALALVRFLLGQDAQRYFADETFEYPLAIGSTPSSAVPPADFGDVSGLDFGVIGDDLGSTRQMIVDAGLAG
ncbi:MAG: extracellular solute-binding protein [Ilumatobacteraceae bacterium]